MVTYRSPREWEVMREAGRVVGLTLQAVQKAAEPGISLAELDAVAARTIKEHNATPSFLHYHPKWSPTPYPATVCISVNEVIVHGIPDGTSLREGDLVSVDCGAIVRGYHGDGAITFAIGATNESGQRLMDVTQNALERAIEAAQPGAKLGDIGYAVERTARDAGYGILEGCTGHGIGTKMHEEPDVPNTGRPGQGMTLKPGLTIAIEPMLIEGGRDEAVVLKDGWSIASADGSRAAHFEHTIAVTDGGPVILTLP